MDIVNLLAAIIGNISNMLFNALIPIIKNHGGYFLTVLVGRIIYTKHQRYIRLRDASKEYALLLKDRFINGNIPPHDILLSLKIIISSKYDITANELPFKEKAFSSAYSLCLLDSEIPAVQKDWFYNNLGQTKEIFCKIDKQAPKERTPTHIKKDSLVYFLFYSALYIMFTFCDGTLFELSMKNISTSLAIFGILSWFMAFCIALLKKLAIDWLEVELTWL